jgi:plasmid stabilization system protein ParE
MCSLRSRQALRVKLTDLAAADLKEIDEHYRRVVDQDLARRMVGRIKVAVLGLAEFPESAPPYELVPGTRCLVVADGLYLVFYRVTEVVEVVEVLHVRRAGRAPAVGADFG